jgi:hypothetical protein
VPRDVYDSPPPNDLSHYPENPVGIASLYITQILEPPLVGPYCQNAVLTSLGETMLHEMMMRGMLIEVDHLPQWSYVRAYELLEAADYPAVGSHGRDYDGRIYQLGGVSATGFGSPRRPVADRTWGFIDKIRHRRGGYPAEGFGFDLNGFAGAAGRDSVTAFAHCSGPDHPTRSAPAPTTSSSAAGRRQPRRLQLRGLVHRAAAGADRGRAPRHALGRGPRAAVPLRGASSDRGAGRARCRTARWVSGCPGWRGRLDGR